MSSSTAVDGLTILFLSTLDKQHDVQFIAVLYRFGHFLRVGAFSVDIDIARAQQIAVPVKKYLFKVGVLADKVVKALTDRASFHRDDQMVIGISTED